MNRPLKGKPLVLVTIGLSLAVFMQVLDSTIANVALPTIAGNLGVAVSQGTWVITSFAVANAISIPLTGFLAKRYGEVKLFLISTSFFLVASLFCGLSTSLGMLILFRVLQGLVAGPMIPLSQSLLLAVYPREKHAIAMGLWSMVIIVAPIFGPIIGGYISDNYYWGWLFFINLPIGLLGLFFCWGYLKHRETPRYRVPIDTVGIILMVIGVTSFQLMLDRGQELGWFESREIVVLFLLSLITFGYFIIWEKGDSNPVINLSLFRKNNFTIGVIVLCLAFMVYLGAIVLIPQLLQIQYGYTAITSGLVTAPIGLFPVLLVPIIGMVGKRLDMRVLVIISFVVFAICFYWRSVTFNINMTFWDVFWPQFFQGIAIALFFTPLTTIIFSQVEAEQIAQASSLSNFLRTLSGAVGTSITISLWDRRQAFHHARLTEYYNALNQNAIDWDTQLKSLGISSPDIGNYLVNQMITQQSFIIGANEIFYAFSILFLMLIGVIWFSRRF
ncbi:MAG: DHA2 family efflux MFS transporter permease subunit [Neisseriaceae bacterium]|nr:MAG: DHA2 family efflux MFS transporter permease subunit [Neisseriaceae bacterium]